MTSFSPYPWRTTPGGAVVSASGEVVAGVLRFADLSVIAAAPELLAELERVLKTHSMCASESARIRAVITKATEAP